MARKKYYQRPDGLYEAIRRIDGKRVYFHGRTQAELERKMREYRGKKEEGRTWEEVIDAWQKEHFPKLAPNTLRGYNPAYERAREAFKGKSIKSIKPAEVQKYINAFAAEGHAKKTVTTQLQIFQMTCAYAVVHDDIEVSPCSAVSVPSGLAKKPREAASAADEAAVKAHAKDWLLPYLILYTGLRKGEALALTYNDIDFGNNCIHVTKSVYHAANKPEIKKPKTEKGLRDVPMLYPLKPYLPNKKSDKYIFSLDGGKTPLSEMQYQKLWKKYAEVSGISCTAHQLRHSFATMLFECDVDAKDAQDILGHAQLSTTMDIYTHIRDARRKQVAAGIDEKLKAFENKYAKSTQDT